MPVSECRCGDVRTAVVTLASEHPHPGIRRRQPPSAPGHDASCGCELRASPTSAVRRSASKCPARSDAARNDTEPRQVLGQPNCDSDIRPSRRNIDPAGRLPHRDASTLVRENRYANFARHRRSMTLLPHLHIYACCTHNINVTPASHRRGRVSGAPKHEPPRRSRKYGRRECPELRGREQLR
jgi:hypothetical protein